MFLDTEVIKNPYDKDRKIMDKIHAFIFVYDSSNKKTFLSMMSIIETVVELEKSRKKGVKLGSDKKKPPPSFYPQKIVVGNKKDLKKNKEAGLIDQKDIEKLGSIKIKEVSALTNNGIFDIFKILLKDLNKD